MLRIMCLVATGLLGACASPEPRDALLAGKDLTNARVISALSNGLNPEDRAAFATYALIHWPGARAFCGRPMFSKAVPATVGDAIAETTAFEDALNRKREEEKRPRSFFEQKAIDEKRLVDVFDQLTLDRDKLAGSDLPADEMAKRLKELDRKLDENRAARRALAAKMPPGPSR